MIFFIILQKPKAWENSVSSVIIYKTFLTNQIAGFVAKDFDQVLIFAKTKKQGKHKCLLTGL